MNGFKQKLECLNHFLNKILLQMTKKSSSNEYAFIILCVSLILGWFGWNFSAVKDLIRAEIEFI